MSRATELHAYLAEMRGRPFEPGQHDCALFVAGWVDRLQGTNLVETWQDRYDSLPAGRKLLRQSGNRSLGDLASKTLPSVGGWVHARLGDVVLIKQHTLCFGIVGGGGVIHCLRADSGYETLPLSRAWEVYRP